MKYLLKVFWASAVLAVCSPASSQTTASSLESENLRIEFAEQMLDRMSEQQDEFGILASAHRRNFPASYARMRRNAAIAIVRGERARFRPIVTEEIGRISAEVLANLERFRHAPIDLLIQQQRASLALLQGLNTQEPGQCRRLASTGSMTEESPSALAEAVRQMASTWDAYGAAVSRPVEREAATTEDIVAFREALVVQRIPDAVIDDIVGPGPTLRPLVGASCEVQLAAGNAALTLPPEQFARIRAFFIAQR